MRTYIGTKVVNAEPMTDAAFKASKMDFTPVANPQEGYRVEYEDGYFSWSPKEVFERCYREITLAEINLILKD